MTYSPLWLPDKLQPRAELLASVDGRFGGDGVFYWSLVRNLAVVAGVKAE
jgi:hypothetical protein